VPHSPPSLPAEGDKVGPKSFNGLSSIPHVPLGSGLRTASGVRDNRALFRQTRHLDDHTSAWNQRHNNQATEWTVSRYSATHAHLPCKPRGDGIWEITTTTEAKLPMSVQ
jgi:hypothetical protein